MKIINLVEDTKGNKSCSAEHGLSFYIETENHYILSDCGATGMFIKNAETLGIDLKKIDTVVLSHGHYDHSGGIMKFSEINETAKIYLKTNADRDYYNLKENKEKYIGIDKRIMELPNITKVNETHKIDDELFLFSNIPHIFPLSSGNSTLKKKVDNTFIQDTFDHEQCLVIAQNNKYILISGCAHNGILNILEKYKNIFNSYPDIVISGFHLVKTTDYTTEDIKDIKNIAHKLLETNALFYSGHCTGQQAFDIMKEIMGNKLIQIHSGDTIL